MGTKIMELRTMARAGTGFCCKSWAVLFWMSNTTPICPLDTSTVRRVVLYSALTPRLMPLSRMDSMV